MALTISGNFAGVKAAGYIYPALLTGNTLGQGLVTIHENVDYRLNVRGITSQGEILRNAECNFTDYGDVTIADTVLEPKELQVNMQLCKKEFRSEWESLEMRGNILNQELPSSFLDFFVDRQLAKVAQGVETAIWQGTAGANGSFAGLEAALAADATVVDVAAVAGGLNAGNIIAQIGLVRDAISNSVYGKEDFSILVPISVQKFYIAAQAALGYQNLYHDGVTGLSFEGIPLKVANGLSDDKMVACRTSDLHFGTNLLTDMGPELRVLDMAELDGSDNVRFILKFTAGTINTNGADIVYYS